MRRHIPSLYSYPEAEGDDVGEDEGSAQWKPPSIHRQLSYGASGTLSTGGSNRTRMKQRSPVAFGTSPGPSGQLPPASVGVNAAKYSELYSQFVKRYRTRPNVFDDPRDDLSAYVSLGGPGLFDDESDEDRPRSPQGIDAHEQDDTPSLDDEPRPYSVEERERLEWQTMLSSVLDGDVLKSEKSRIHVALMNSPEAVNNRHLDIWIGIRAKLRARKVEEERKLLEERKMHLVDRVIGEIMQFSVIDGPEAPSAAHQVSAVLQHLDRIQSFYPHLKAFHLDRPAATSPEFQARCDTLITWLSVLHSLRQQISLFRRWTGSETLDVTAPSPEHGMAVSLLVSN